MSHRALLVPGQGSQFVGMGEFLIQEFPQSKKVFEEASDAIGADLKKLCFTGPETDLALTHNTQPAILT
ncbi:MAG: malonyl CoA-acyl carrier protein transacylase, partial [Pseudobdellovibrionaceae bacterium]